MDYTRLRLEKYGFDQSQWKKYYQQHQQEYKRIKLKSIYAYWQGQSFTQVSKSLGKNQRTIRNYINTYLSGGFQLLCQSIRRDAPSRLSKAQCLSFKQVILNSSPDKHGINGNIWTAEHMRTYLLKTYQVSYSSGIYVLLKRLGLSYQRAHSDYQNADLSKQNEFIEHFKQTLLSAQEHTAVLAYDEFSVSEHPSSYYGWAEKNTRPKVKTDEKKTKN